MDLKRDKSWINLCFQAGKTISVQVRFFTGNKKDEKATLIKQREEKKDLKNLTHGFTVNVTGEEERQSAQ